MRCLHVKQCGASAQVQMAYFVGPVLHLKIKIYCLYFLGGQTINQPTATLKYIWTHKYEFEIPNSSWMELDDTDWYVAQCNVHIFPLKTENFSVLRLKKDLFEEDYVWSAHGFGSIMVWNNVIILLENDMLWKYFSHWTCMLITIYCLNYLLMLQFNIGAEIPKSKATRDKTASWPAIIK